MKHIDKIFKEKLYNHEAEVPEGMWEKIAPIGEEESTRALIWFWFAGILALLVGGYGIYKMISTHNQNPDPSALVLKTESRTQTTDILVDNSFLTKPNTQKENGEVIVEPLISATQNSRIENSMGNQTSNNPTIRKPRKKSSEVKNQSRNLPIQKFSNTVENISNVGGVPANLVITKSYVNKSGSVIKQSNLTEESGNDGRIYDVIINSEAKDLNAGTLLRLIEPLEYIPLPAFQKELKKKSQDIIIL